MTLWTFFPSIEHFEEVVNKLHLSSVVRFLVHLVLGRRLLRKSISRVPKLLVSIFFDKEISSVEDKLTTSSNILSLNMK